MTELNRQPESGPPAATPPGLVHAYQKFDPKEFPPPTAEPPDFAGAAMEHMLMYGSMRDLTPEELARAVKIDPSMFGNLGPSLDAIGAMLEERRRKILETYETQAAQTLADRAYRDAARDVRPEKNWREEFERAVRSEQVPDLERLWYKQRSEQSPASRALLKLIDRLGDKYQIEELASRWEFTGREPMSVEEALEIKRELEEIERLLEQIKEARKNAQIGIIDLDALKDFVSEADIEGLQALREQVEDYMRQEAARQGIEQAEGDRGAFRLTPAAMRLFQGRLLTEIFTNLQASRSGRHESVATDDGVQETASTKPYEFGDPVASMDVPGSFVNALIRQGGAPREGLGGKLSFGVRDIEVHRTKKAPKCATMVVLDMSGSMRQDGQYINAKRMALALDGLVRREYPGDFLSFVEVYSLAKRRHISEIASLMPKPVTLRSPVVRMKVDLSKPEVSEALIPPHFTNLQRGLQLARQQLAVQDTPNRQVMLITDGLPTAHFEGSVLYLLYPPDPLTEEATMREARLCAREGITINIFLLPNWWQSSEDIQFAHRIAEETRGRVFFTAGKDLDRFVLWDYVNHRRKIIG
ncbi:MAG: hypothetical protein SFY95_09400 [Planctomycetota bacterium]|nr:hypothetical protein [Planctomycetota bacterium]